MTSHLSPPPQGLHPFVRTEAWKFLTGYYSWQSSQDERLTVDSTRRWNIPDPVTGGWVAVQAGGSTHSSLTSSVFFPKMDFLFL